MPFGRLGSWSPEPSHKQIKGGVTGERVHQGGGGLKQMVKRRRGKVPNKKKKRTSK